MAADLLPGMAIHSIPCFEDIRGDFRKLFCAGRPDREMSVKEIYITRSVKNVIRGMHLQTAGEGMRKLVFVECGRVLDVVVDVRRGAGFGKLWHQEVDGSDGLLIEVPAGCAHGFLVLSNSASLVYMVDQNHDPSTDIGVCWNSIGFQWPVRTPIISPRDSQLPRLDELAI